MKLLNLTLISHKNSNSLRIEEELWVECFVSITSLSWKNTFLLAYFMLNVALSKVIVEAKFFYDFNSQTLEIVSYKERSEGNSVLFFIVHCLEFPDISFLPMQYGEEFAQKKILHHYVFLPPRDSIILQRF